jgi:hypothetical protein
LFFYSWNILSSLKTINITVLFKKYLDSRGEYLGPEGMRMGTGRRFYNEELKSLYRSPNIVRVIKWKSLKCTGDIARMEEGRSAFKIFTDKPRGKGLLVRPKR